MSELRDWLRKAPRRREAREIVAREMPETCVFESITQAVQTAAERLRAATVVPPEIGRAASY